MSGGVKKSLAAGEVLRPDFIRVDAHRLHHASQESRGDEACGIRLSYRAGAVVAELEFRNRTFGGRRFEKNTVQLSLLQLEVLAAGIHEIMSALDEAWS